MSASAVAKAPAIPAWRYKTGLSLFVIGNVATFTSPVFVPALGLNPAYIGAAIILAECVILCSVFFLGWKGVKELKGKMLGAVEWLFRPGEPGAKPVSRPRFRLGMFLVFALSLVMNYLAFLLMILAYANATPTDPFPATWGIPYEWLGWAVGGLFFGGEISIVAGLFVLGDEWWDRFRDLFIWRGAEVG